jgi:signal transduction histidine kinase
MAATIAHEINNPLEAVSNLLYLAHTSEDIPPAVSERLTQADLELRRVAHITRQALGFYRENATPALTDIYELLDSTLEMLRSKIDSKDIIIDRDRTKSIQVLGVAGELRQVFSNLIVNSVDAVDRGGRIMIRTSECTMRNGQPGVLVTFADNGKGIDSSSKSHIFEPLYTTKGSVGTGLGLWVSKEIIDKHRGTIRMRSSTREPKRGTAFGIFIPK